MPGWGRGGAGAGGEGGCPDVGNAALITKTRYQAGVGLRSDSEALSLPQYTTSRMSTPKGPHTSGLGKGRCLQS